MNKTIFITGAAGYVGAMLCQQFAGRDDVEKIIALDREDKPELLAGLEKIIWIKANTAESFWHEEVAKYEPDTVIHTAWQIREMYGNQKEQWRWNVEGSEAVFKFAFETPSVKKLIHFSTVASYGADSKNSIDYRFTEEDRFRKTDYLYAEEKRIVEEKLHDLYEKAENPPQVIIVRPAAVTGPRGRYMRIRFGLQAALSGQLKENFIHKLISAMVSFVPVTKKWCRQFIHEDDVSDIIELLTFKEVSGKYQIFNICPPGPVVTGSDMADAVNKKTVRVHPWLIRLVFFIMWHASRGKVPTSRGGWRSYSYPIAVDGSKITKLCGYQYKYEPKEAFVKKEGRYTKYIK